VGLVSFNKEISLHSISEEKKTLRVIYEIKWNENNHCSKIRNEHLYSVLNYPNISTVCKAVQFRNELFVLLRNTTRSLKKYGL